MVIALTQHCLKPSSSIYSFPLTRERMSSKPGLRQQASKKSRTTAARTEQDTSRPVMTPLASRGVPGKCLPRLSPESPRGGGGKRTRRVVVMRRASEGSCISRSGVSTVVELPGINARRHSVAGTISTVEESSLEVFVSPLLSCSSVASSEAAVGTHVSSSPFRARERPLLVRRSGPGTTPMPPSSPRSLSTGPVEPNNNRPHVKSSYGSSRHFELTLQKIEETKPHHQDSGFPLRSRRKIVQRKNAVSSIDRPYLGGEDYHDFRSSVDGRRYANISEMPTEYAQELLSHQEEEDIGLPEETEDEHLRQKCLKWLETLPQN